MIELFDMSHQVSEMPWTIENGACAKLIPVGEVIFQLYLFMGGYTGRNYVLPWKHHDMCCFCGQRHNLKLNLWREQVVATVLCAHFNTITNKYLYNV